MNCDKVRRHWSLYHDSEGDAQLHFQIGEHLTTCSTCQQWYAAQSRLESEITRRLRKREPTPELWDAVLAPVRRGVRRSRRWLVGALAAGLAAIIVAALLLKPMAKVEAHADLVRLAGTQHQRLASRTQTVDFRTVSDLGAEAYLRDAVPFPVRCPPRKDSGFTVRGVGVCAMADEPAAYLTGSVDDSPVSIFVLPRGSLVAFPAQDRALRNQPLVRSTDAQFASVLGVIDRNAVLVVGRTEPARLERVLNAYGSYPDHH